MKIITATFIFVVLMICNRNIPHLLQYVLDQSYHILYDCSINFEGIDNKTLIVRLQNIKNK